MDWWNITWAFRLVGEEEKERRRKAGGNMCIARKEKKIETKRKKAHQRHECRPPGGDMKGIKNFAPKWKEIGKERESFTPMAWPSSSSFSLHPS